MSRSSVIKVRVYRGGQLLPIPRKLYGRVWLPVPEFTIMPLVEKPTECVGDGASQSGVAFDGLKLHG